MHNTLSQVLCTVHAVLVTHTMCVYFSMLQVGVHARVRTYVCTCILMVHIDLYLYLCLYTILYLHSPLLVKEGSTNPPGPSPVPVAGIVCGVLAVVVVGLDELCCCSSCSNRHLWAQCQCTVMTA